MATSYTNFYYDPIVQGYDASTWRTLSGAPTVANQLRVSSATTVSYAQMLRGQFTFSVNVPLSPATGHSRSFGLYRPSDLDYILFNITDTVFSATSSARGVTTSSVIAWDAAWSDTDTEYAIMWEGGTAHFFIAGNKVATISDDSISGVPMSLYVSNGGSDDMTVKYINCQGIQSYYGALSNITTTGPSPYVSQPLVSKSESITATENVTMLITIHYAPGITDPVTVTENVALTIV